MNTLAQPSPALGTDRAAARNTLPGQEPLSGKRNGAFPSAAGVNSARSDSPATEGYMK